MLVANLFVLLSLLPPPPPLQSYSLRSALHHGIQTLPQHQIPVMEAPHSWKTHIARHTTPDYSEVFLFKKNITWNLRLNRSLFSRCCRSSCNTCDIWAWTWILNVSPKEAACRRQLPSPVVANGSSFLQLAHMVDHQFKRPIERFKHNDLSQTWTDKHHPTSYHALKTKINLKKFLVMQPIIFI